MSDSDLNDATDLGFPNALAAGPGQFAARWNAHSEEERDAWLAQQQHAASVAVRCEFIEQHAEQLQQYRRTLEDLDALAHRLAVLTPWRPQVWAALLKAASTGTPEEVVLGVLPAPGTPREFPCPSCGAAVGEPCRNRDGSARALFHLARSEGRR